jgi:hypothetical protein
LVGVLGVAICGEGGLGVAAVESLIEIWNKVLVGICSVKLRKKVRTHAWLVRITRSTHDTQHDTRHAACTRHARSTRNTQYAIRNTQYAIRNTQYAIRNTQYAIRNKSANVQTRNTRNPII